MIGSHLLSVLLAAGDTAHASDHGHHRHFPVALPTEGGHAGLVLALPLIAMIPMGLRHLWCSFRFRLGPPWPVWASRLCGRAQPLPQGGHRTPRGGATVRVDQPFVGTGASLPPLVCTSTV